MRCAAHAVRRVRGAGRAVLCVGRAPDRTDAIRRAGRADRRLRAGRSARAPRRQSREASRARWRSFSIARPARARARRCSTRSPRSAKIDRCSGEGAPLIVLLTAPAVSAPAASGRGAPSQPVPSTCAGAARGRGTAARIAREPSRSTPSGRSRRACRASTRSSGGGARRGPRVTASGAVALSASGAPACSRGIALERATWRPERSGAGSALAGRAASCSRPAPSRVGPRGRGRCSPQGGRAFAKVRPGRPRSPSPRCSRHGVAPLHGERRHDGDPCRRCWARPSSTLEPATARAEAAATRAILGVGDPEGALGLLGAVARRAGGAAAARRVQAARLLRSAELALRVGGADQRARARAPRRLSDGRHLPTPTVLLGRGDGRARRPDDRARSRSPAAMEIAASASARAQAAAEMAEVYCIGRPRSSDARRLAGRGARLRSLRRAAASRRAACSASLLLEGARWVEAEAHFAADAWDAACAGEALAAELRARLNRAIALM